MRHPHSMAYLATFAFGALLLGAAAIGCGEEFQSSGGNGSSSGSGGEVATGGAGGTTSSSSSSTSGTGGAPPTCVDLGEACSQCELESCPDIYCNCYENLTCQLVIVCLAQCPVGYNSCSQACYSNHTQGIADAALVGHCAATDCSGVCVLGLQPLEPCDYCLFESCEAEVNACLAEQQCAQLLYCAATCSDPGCVDGCVATYPGGQSLSVPLRACMNSNCSSDCAWAD